MALASSEGVVQRRVRPPARRDRERRCERGGIADAVGLRIPVVVLRIRHRPDATVGGYPAVDGVALRQRLLDRVLPVGDGGRQLRPRGRRRHRRTGGLLRGGARGHRSARRPRRAVDPRPGVHGPVGCVVGRRGILDPAVRRDIRPRRHVGPLLLVGRDVLHAGVRLRRRAPSPARAHPQPDQSHQPTTEMPDRAQLFHLNRRASLQAVGCPDSRERLKSSPPSFSGCFSPSPDRSSAAATGLPSSPTGRRRSP